MLQQINLYNALPKPAPIILSIPRMKKICFIFIGFLFLMSIYQELRNLWFQHELTQVQTQQKEATNQLVQAKTYAAQILNENQQLKQVLLSNTELLKKSQGRNEQHGIYVLTFTELAKNIIPGIWLTNIKIAQTNKQIILTGNTVTIDALITYIQKINEDPMFFGSQFKILKLSNPKPEVGPISFILIAKQ